MCASELCDERVERLLSSDFPGGADGGQGQFLVGRGNGPRSRRWPAMRRGGRRASSRCRFSRRRRATAFSSRLRRRGRRRRNRRRSRAPRSGIRGRRLSARRAVPASVFWRPCRGLFPDLRPGCSAACRFCAGPWRRRRPCCFLLPRAVRAGRRRRPLRPFS